MSKRVAFFILLFSFLSVKSQNLTVDDFIEEHNIEFSKVILSTLTHPYYEGRDIKKPHIYRTQSFLENLFRSYNIKAYFDSYRVPYKIRDGLFGINLVGVYRGDYRSKNAVLITANYDNLGLIKTGIKKDSIYPGANDNATGVAALIQTAYIINKLRPKQNVVFALTSGKIINRIGAGLLADTLKKHNFLKIKWAVNLEMLGKPMTTIENNILSIEDTMTNFVPLMNEYVGERFSIREVSEEFKERSEHSAFFNVLKIPAVTLTSFNLGNDENYMTLEDDMDNIDLNYFQRTVSRIVFALYQILVDEREVGFMEKSKTIKSSLKIQED